MNNVSKIVEAVKSVLPKDRPIEHHEAYYDAVTASRYIHKSLILGIQKGYSKSIFEDKLLQLTGAEQCVTTSSGTAALTVALRSFDIGTHINLDVVIVPSATFAGTANAVHHAGASPFLIDTDGPLTAKRLKQFLESGAVKHYLDGQKLEVRWKTTSQRFRAVIPVHLFGHPVDVPAIMKVAEEYNLVVIEDCAQALGSKLRGQHVGTFGHAGIFSFNNNKIVTTNGGGAIVTNHPWVSAKAFQLANTARVPHPYLIEHDEMAWNYRLGEINAALGLAQLEHFRHTLDIKRKLHFKYRRALDGLCEFFEPTEDSESNFWLTVISIKPDERDLVLNRLHAEGIRARAMFSPLHRSPYYRYSCIEKTYWPVQYEHDMTRCESFWSRAVCLPSSPALYNES